MMVMIPLVYHDFERLRPPLPDAQAVTRRHRGSQVIELEALLLPIGISGRARNGNNVYAAGRLVVEEEGEGTWNTC